MEFSAHTLFGYFHVIFFLVVPIPSSELFPVHSLIGPVVALVGEEAKLHCYISPVENAEHIEVHWYHEPFTKPLQLYRRDNDYYRETSLDNTEQTEILNEDIGKGDITLRIQNVSVSDGGKYRCLFKNGNFTKETVLELKVLAPGSELEIQLETHITQGIQIKCFSGGWFPQPQMQWVNSRGELLPPSSQSESLNEAGLFHTHITFLLEQSQGRITCWLRHSVTGQEKKTSIQVADILFQQQAFKKKIWTHTVIAAFLLSVLISILIFQILFLKCKFKMSIVKIVTGPLSLLKVLILFMTPAVVCCTILYACVIFGIQGSQFPIKKGLMKSIVQDISFSVCLATLIIALTYGWILHKYIPNTNDNIKNKMLKLGFQLNTKMLTQGLSQRKRLNKS